MHTDDNSTFDTIRSFLSRIINRQFLVFLFFVVLSAIFWIIQTFNETYEKEIKIPVHIVNVPKNVVLTSAEVDTVRLTVRDKGWMIFSYLYGDLQFELRLNYKNYDKGNGTGTASASELKRLIDQQLESSSKIISVKPDKLEFSYNNGEYKRVPVRWTGRVMPDQLFFIDHTEYEPDSVDVYASKEKLDSIRYIETEPLNHVGFRDTLRVTCQLSHPANVKVVPEQIKVRFVTDVLTEESINVPIGCINLPAGKVLRTFPAKVRVHFVTGASRIRLLRPEDFTVVADYAEIDQKPSEKCNLYLRQTPPGISRATLSAKQVDYLIEEE
ncbi:MAG: YbbR-like domain-containing protein [Prevotella sp.]|nr:YbbR-like domain-containing protein [Prevotella sp.]